MEADLEIRLDRTGAAHRHIRDQMREKILAGHLAAGARLPPTRQLAANWKVDPFTVHTALAALVKEGLLTRQPGKGTFVRERPRAEQLTAVGLYISQDIWSPNFSFWLQTLYRELLAELEHQHIHMSTFTDPRPAWQHQQPWPELADLARERRMQAVISLSSGWGRFRWLNKLPVPAVHFTTAKVPNKIDVDVRQMMQLALGRLAEQGCRSVGLLAPFNPRHVDAPDDPNTGGKAVRTFLDVAGEFGLTVKQQWIRISNVDSRSQSWNERFGYREFRALWQQPWHPDGLFVYDDTTARGVITALLEEKVRVPEELKLVFQRNAEIDLLCPLPASYAVFSVREAARAAVRMIQKLYRGETVEPVRLSCRLVVGTASSQQETNNQEPEGNQL